MAADKYTRRLVTARRSARRLGLTLQCRPGQRYVLVDPITGQATSGRDGSAMTLAEVEVTLSRLQPDRGPSAG